MQTSVERYEAMYLADETVRTDAYRDLVERYYDLVTDFYERGWGKSFHFAPRYPHETFELAIQRHEHVLALRLGLTAGMRVLDVGCGVGGPMRAIARLTGARIDGINTNEGQLARLARHTEHEGLTALCRGVYGDFMRLPSADESYDAAYAIEATCHAPDRKVVFAEIARALVPGGRFGGYEWVVTDKFDAADPHHRELAARICRGNGLPKMTDASDVRDALERAGFEVLALEDAAGDQGEGAPWYAPLEGEGATPARLSRLPFMRPVMRTALATAEKLKLVPEGTRRVSDILNDGADALVEAGRLGIFTPCLFFLARKQGDACRSPRPQS
jgi:sterol 24-C-methyltransferase